MIVRIFSEGQYRVADSERERVDQLDETCRHAVEAGDGAAFATTFAELLDYVRDHGELLGEDELEGSDIMLPPPDISLEEARAEFTGEGLIPD
ncbi:MAG TPA: hypothetical protein VHM72_02680 [Solirubrobacteraceae bacterium]|nr:hypothetical protein [Solirubrobacteraceae bacterium]